MDSSAVVTAVGWVGVAFLLLPIIIAVVTSVDPGDRLAFPPTGLSLRWYDNLFSNVQWRIPLLRSCLFGLASSTIAVAVGTAGAYGLIHLKRGRSLWLAIFLLPLLVPPVVLAVGQYFWFARFGLIDTWLGVILSHAVITFPIALIFTIIPLSRAGLRGEDIACSLGARRWYAFLRVTLPDILPSLVAAALLSFITAFDESVLSLFLTSYKAKTLPRQMFEGLKYNLDPTMAAVAGMAAIFWLMVLVIALLFPKRQALITNQQS
jgi:ABC-type spermidine/putrescine transport system permease subunit II